MSLNRPSSQEHFDRSGTIQPQADPTIPQTVFPYNPRRIGLYLQNQSANPLWLLVMPITPTESMTPTRIKVAAGDEFYYDQFAPVNEIRIAGELGSPFAASEFGI